MFRAQQNAFDDAVGKFSSVLSTLARAVRKLDQAEPQRSARDVRHPTLDRSLTRILISTAKATDENLTSENWEYILVRC
jgi:hypothetical protein